MNQGCPNNLRSNPKCDENTGCFLFQHPPTDFFISVSIHILATVSTNVGSHLSYDEIQGDIIVVNSYRSLT